jgi:hypothetical protein
MKKALMVALIAVAAWHHWFQQDADSGYAGALPPAPKERTSKGLSTVQFIDLMDSDRSLDDLTKLGYYTIVEVYLDSCKICKRLESRYPTFLRARRDVLVRKVHFPEGGMQLNIQGLSQHEAERAAAAFNAQVDSHQICGTPHIEIYDPKGQLLARDVCGQKRGLAYLRDWIGSELGRPASSI